MFVHFNFTVDFLFIHVCVVLATQVLRPFMFLIFIVNKKFSLVKHDHNIDAANFA